MFLRDFVRRRVCKAVSDGGGVSKDRSLAGASAMLPEHEVYAPRTAAAFPRVNET